MSLAGLPGMRGILEVGNEVLRSIGVAMSHKYVPNHAGDRAVEENFQKSGVPCGQFLQR